jgi:hypothetical protein
MARSLSFSALIPAFNPARRRLGRGPQAAPILERRPVVLIAAA